MDGRSGRAPLVLVSNRGPVTFQDDGTVKRGGGGLVTALTGLASHRDAVWIASAMTDGDAEHIARDEHGAGLQQFRHAEAASVLAAGQPRELRSQHREGGGDRQRDHGEKDRLDAQREQPDHQREQRSGGQRDQ